MAQKKNDESSLPIIIIGAGAAGLTAAEELQKAGQNYLILEGRDRVGGRIHTQNWPLTHPTLFELGAAWFHDVPHNRLAFVAEDEGFESGYDDDQTEIYDLEGKLDQNEINSMSTRFDEYRAKRDPQDPLEQVATLFIKDLQNKDEQRTASAVAYAYQLAAGLNAAQIGAHFRAQEGRDKAVQGGYIRLFEGLIAKDVDKSKLKLKTKVTRVNSPKQGDKVVVSTQDGEHIEGKAVIVTAPLAVLKNDLIQFEPALNGHLRKAINNTGVAHLEKVYLTFPSSFWSPTTFRYVISDAENPALVWNWEATHPGTQQKNTVAVLVTNETAAKVNKNPDEAFSIVTPILKAIAGDKDIPEPTQVIASSWMPDEFSQGSFSVVPHGQTREELAQPFIDGEPRNRILFAGEHATVEGAGWVQGAWESAQRAVKQALEL